MVRGSTATDGRWSMSIVHAPTDHYPLFCWEFGELTGTKSPLYASAKYGGFMWSLGEDRAESRDPDGVLGHVASRGWSVPPLIYEVGAVLEEFAPRLRKATEEEKRTLYHQLEERWRDLLANPAI